MEADEKQRKTQACLSSYFIRSLSFPPRTEVAQSIVKGEGRFIAFSPQHIATHLYAAYFLARFK